MKPADQALHCFQKRIKKKKNMGMAPCAYLIKYALWYLITVHEIMVFIIYALMVTRSRVRCLKLSAKPEVFNIS